MKCGVFLFAFAAEINLSLVPSLALSLNSLMALLLLFSGASAFAPRMVAPLGGTSSWRAVGPRCAVLELSRPPFIEDVIDSSTGQKLKIDPRNDGWLCVC